MAGLVPAIHDLFVARLICGEGRKSWMPGTRLGMTRLISSHAKGWNQGWKTYKEFFMSLSVSRTELERSV
jgi:hypothetical protein